MNKRILTTLLTIVLVFLLTTPIMAATEPKTKTFVYKGGKYYEEPYLSDSKVTIKVTNVISKEKKNFSVDLSDGKKKIKFSGKNSNVITCKKSTKITLVPPKDFETYEAFGMILYYDDSNSKYIKSNFKYYTFIPESEEVITSTKYNKVPKDDWVVADGSSFTVTKAGTYVLYVRPFGFYGYENEDYELTPVFIIVK